MTGGQQDVYGRGERPDLAPFVPPGARTVLDVGCASGGFARTLRGVLGEGVRIVGVEAVPAAARRARAELDDVIEGFFPTALEGRVERYDLICFNDVLEHMVDPWDALALAHQWLSPSGTVLASIPNVQYGPHLQAVLAGRWEYTDTGILDRTHLRFFTRASMLAMFAHAGYAVERCTGINSAWSKEWRGVIRGSACPVAALARRTAYAAVRRPLIGLRPDLEWQQFVIVARPAGS
nr:class I SAM-dependent methyltransferase [Propionibacterium sp.]